jgi:lipoprotein-releasing system permease protein
MLSMAGIAFSTAALIIVLSVFNGLEGLLRSLYTSFDPELKIELVKGKMFDASREMIQKLEAVEGVELVTEVIEDYAVMRYNGVDMVVMIRGVSDNFLEQHRLDDHIIQGELKLKKDSTSFAILGAGVSSSLSVDVTNEMFALQVFYIKNTKSTSLDPSKLYARKSIRPTAVFSIEKNFDENYVFLPLSFAQSLLDLGDKRTFLEVKTKTGSNINSVKSKIEEVLGKDFNVLTNDEQHKDLYRLMKMEKLFTFIVLSLLIVVGSINIFFSLMMLAIDKKKDVTLLTAMGANQRLIRNIFLTEGALISFTGAVIGLLIGGVLVYAQDKYDLVSMGMANAIVSGYPVEMRLTDFVTTGLMITVVTFIVSYYPAHKASRFYSTEYL